jgi:hypothetical protein
VRVHFPHSKRFVENVGGWGVGGQRLKLEGGEWVGNERRKANVTLCCGDTSWLVSRIIIFDLLWEQVTKHDLSTLHVRNELN